MSKLSEVGVSEFSIATDLAAQLSKNGSCVLEYVTAEMQPFSNAQRPDLVYRPASGPFTGQTVFIEIKTTLKHSVVDNLEDHLQFAEDYISAPIFLYFYVSSECASDLLKRRLRKKRIHVIDRIKSVQDIIEVMNREGL